MAGIAGCCAVARPAQRGAGIRPPWALVLRPSSRWRLHGRTTGGCGLRSRSTHRPRAVQVL